MPLVEYYLQGSRALTLVNWLHAPTQYGQTVALDPRRNNTIMFSMVLRHPWQSFAGCTVVHPAIGVAMRKAAASRPLVPQKVMRLWRMWDRAISPGDLSAWRMSLPWRQRRNHLFSVHAGVAHGMCCVAQLGEDAASRARHPNRFASRVGQR